MDKEHVKGAAKDAQGKLKEAAGKATGDRRTEQSGKADQAEGKLQNEWGEAKDTVRDAVDGDDNV